MTKAHLYYICFRMFRTRIESAQFKCSKLKEHLRTLCAIYGLNHLKSDCFDLYQSGYFKGQEGKLVFEALKMLIGVIRPQFIPLIEAFEISDSIVPSAIGNKYGDIYETQFEWAKNSPLNKLSKPPGFEHQQYIMKTRL